MLSLPASDRKSITRHFWIRSHSVIPTLTALLKAQRAQPQHLEHQLSALSMAMDSAVQSILAAAVAPLAPQDVARAFRGKRAATVRPVVEGLAGIGMARRLQDGRYAA